MKIKKPFRYFGGKNYLIGDIISLVNYAYKNLRISCLIDVFGGSGTVLFSIPENWKINLIYNDLDNFLYNVFKVLQDDDLRQKLIEKWKYLLTYDVVYKEFRDELFRSEDFDFHVPDIEVALKWLYLNIYGQSGIVSKSATMPLMYVYRIRKPNFDNDVIKKLKQWQITNKDYRDLIRNANREYVFLYLDPPYLQGGSNYNKGGWDIDDFKELKTHLDNFKGYWLLNESSIESIQKIFGKPLFVKSYINSSHVITYDTIKNSKNKRNIRKEGFWTNFKIPDELLQQILNDQLRISTKEILQNNNLKIFIRLKPIGGENRGRG